MRKASPPCMKPVYECMFHILQEQKRLPKDCETPWQYFRAVFAKFCIATKAEEMLSCLKGPDQLGFLPIQANGVAFRALREQLMEALSSGHMDACAKMVLDGLRISKTQYVFTDRSKTALYAFSVNRYGKIDRNLRIVYNGSAGTRALPSQLNISEIYTMIQEFRTEGGLTEHRLQVETPVKSRKVQSSSGEEEDDEELVDQEGREQDQALEDAGEVLNESSLLRDDIKKLMKQLAPGDLQSCLVSGFTCMDKAHQDSVLQQIANRLHKPVDQVLPDARHRGCRSEAGEPAARGPALQVRQQGVTTAAHIPVEPSRSGAQEAAPAQTSQGSGSLAQPCAEPRGSASVVQSAGKDPAHCGKALTPSSGPQPGVQGHAVQSFTMQSRWASLPKDASAVIRVLQDVREGLDSRHLVGAYTPLVGSPLFVPPHVLVILREKSLSPSVFFALMALFENETLVAYLVLVTLDVVLTKRGDKNVGDAMPEVRARVEQWIRLTREPFGLLHVGLNLQFGCCVGDVDLRISSWIEQNQPRYPQLCETWHALRDMFVPLDKETITAAESYFVQTFTMAVIANHFCDVLVVPAHVVQSQLSVSGPPAVPADRFLLVSYTTQNEQLVPVGHSLPHLPEYAGMIPEFCARTSDGCLQVDPARLIRHIMGRAQEIAAEERTAQEHEVRLARERLAEEQGRQARAMRLFEESRQRREAHNPQAQDRAPEEEAASLALARQLDRRPPSPSTRKRSARLADRDQTAAHAEGGQGQAPRTEGKSKGSGRRARAMHKGLASREGLKLAPPAISRDQKVEVHKFTGKGSVLPPGARRKAAENGGNYRF